MKMTTMALALSALALDPMAGASDAPPRQYPSLDKQTTTLAFVVANVGQAAMLPASEACRTGSLPEVDGKVRIVWCLHDPLYFRADVLMTVYGKLSSSPLYVATSSHYGTSLVDNARSPVLVRLHTDGAHTIMPAYAMHGLVADKSGELYLIARSQNSDVSCWGREIRQPIATLDLPAQETIAEDKVSVTEKASIDQFLVRAGQGYLPKYAISMTRLQAHLAAAKPGVETACPK